MRRALRRLALVVHVRAICGSLQASSGNARLAAGVAAAAGGGVQVTVWEGLADVPPIRPDAADDGGPAVAALREQVAGADHVLVATPEYAGGMPGTLKNAFDWLVGSGELYGRPVVVVSAAPTEERGAGARRWTEETLRMQGADVRASFSLALRRDDPPEARGAAVAAVLEALEEAARPSAA
jgi:NAD(P)H-dependent FMN reductase